MQFIWVELLQSNHHVGVCGCLHTKSTAMKSRTNKTPAARDKPPLAHGIRQIQLSVRLS